MFPWIFIYYGNQKVKRAATLISKATALRVAQLQREMIKSYKILLRT